MGMMVGLLWRIVKSGYGGELTMVCSGMIRKTVLFLIILSMAFPVPDLLFVRRCVMRMAFGLETPKGSYIWMQCG